MFDLTAIEDMAHDIKTADQKIRKEIDLPEDMDDPAEVASKLAGLAVAAASAAQSMTTVMSHRRQRELLTAQLKSEAASAK